MSKRLKGNWIKKKGKFKKWHKKFIKNGKKLRKLGN